MKTITTAEQHSSPVSRSTTRCLRLAAVREEFGLNPLLFGVGEVRLGADPDADFPLPFSGIAPVHVVIEFDGQVAIAASQHPMSWLNDGPFRRSRLKRGDRLALGPIELVVDYVDVPEPPPVPRAEFVESPEGSHTADEQWSGLRPEEDNPRGLPEHALRSLLEEAEASRGLRDDLRRLTEEVARLRTHGTGNGADIPRAPRTPAELPLARGRRNPVGAHRKPDAATRGEAEPAIPTPTIDELAVARERAALDAERRQLEDRRTALEADRRDFDAAVEALDEDRHAWMEQVRREREALESQARRLTDDRQALESTAAELRAQSQTLLAKEQGLTDYEQSLNTQRRELDERIQQCERKHADVEHARRELNHRAGESSSTLESLRRELQAERDRLTRELTRIQTEQARATAERQAAETLRNDLSEQTEALEARRQRLQAEEASHRESAAKLHSREQHLAAREEELDQRDAAFGDRAASVAEHEQNTSPNTAAASERLRQLEAEASRLRDVEAQLHAELMDYKARAESLEAAATAQPRDVSNDISLAEPQGTPDREWAEAEWTRIREAEQRLAELRETLDLRGRQLSADRKDHEQAIHNLERARVELQEARTHLDRDSLSVQSRHDLLAEQESILESRWTKLREQERRAREDSVATQPGMPVAGDDGTDFGVVGESTNQESGVGGLSAQQLTPAEIAELPLASQIACFLGDHDAVKSRSQSGENGNAARSPSRELPRPQPAECTPEVEADPPSTDEAADNGDTIRSQLAALFGIPKQEIDASERRHPELVESRDARPSSHGSKSALSPSGSSVRRSLSDTSPTAAAEGADPVAAYMEKLLGRYQQQMEAVTESVGEVANEARHESTRPNDDAADVKAAASETTPSGGPAVAARRRPDGEDLERMKADLLSMRQLANLSARSAVATHHSRQLGIAYQVKLVLTMLAGFVTIALLTAELWGATAYYWQGLASLAVTVISGSQLLRTSMIMHKMQRRAQSTEVEAAESQNDAPQEPPAA